ncbi:helix-turn-helix transcriptional regulator [Paenibacillus arenilitoris]|uniref:YafY family transcriptional regulator n=1 Tax=Paenibacillus arenilitoris TaxID=2772299 RepID=A0A927CRU1_9BACL|nr:YafY family protein [Paenibacillus arenilitoris]MBD2872325.1 YafY family transcriptional regulator [Paenibacillus arenilitoris]
MRAGRLLSIVLLMQNYGKLTAKELAEKLEVSERTILRDMDSLSGAGVPVYAERGQRGGWALSEGYRTNLTGMRAEELASVLVASQSGLLGDLGIEKHFEAAVQKLLAASPDEASKDAALARQKIHIDGAGWHRSNETAPLLSVVQEAVWEERKLRIAYGREDGPAERVVHPLGLVAKRSVWYLVAESEGELRTYRISRLTAAETLAERFERRPGFDLAACWEQSISEFKRRLPKYPAKVKVREATAGRLAKERFVRLAEPMPADGGWMVAEAEFETLESACEIVLSFGRRIEVLEPEELRAMVRAEAAASAALHEGEH